MIEKQLIQTGLEFLFCTLLYDEIDENRNDSTWVKLFDDDIQIQNLDNEISDIWCSLWSNNPGDLSGMHFNEEKERVSPQL